MCILNKEVKGNVSSYLKYFSFRVYFHAQENVKFMTYSEPNSNGENCAI